MNTNVPNRFPARFAAMLGLVMLLSGFGTGNAFANSQVTVAGNGAPASASATVKFRIVVAETLRLGGQQQRQAVTAPALTRTVAIQDGRQVVTLARP